MVGTSAQYPPSLALWIITLNFTMLSLYQDVVYRHIKLFHLSTMLGDFLML